MRFGHSLPDAPDAPDGKSENAEAQAEAKVKRLESQKQWLLQQQRESPELGFIRAALGSIEQEISDARATLHVCWTPDRRLRRLEIRCSDAETKRQKRAEAAEAADKALQAATSAREQAHRALAEAERECAERQRELAAAGADDGPADLPPSADGLHALGGHRGGGQSAFDRQSACREPPLPLGAGATERPP